MTSPSVHTGRFLLLAFIAIGFLHGCGATALDVFETCDLDMELSVQEASPGDTVAAYGGPFSEVRDTLLTVGGVDATVVSVEDRDDRSGKSVDLSATCEQCFQCRRSAGCAACGTCSGVLLNVTDRLECFGNPQTIPYTPGACDLCVQQVVFEVPSVAPGAAAVWTINRFGASAQVPFTVAGVAETADTSMVGDTAATGATGSPMTADTAP